LITRTGMRKYYKEANKNKNESIKGGLRNGEEK
jgi:hypothetical protein